MKSYYEHGGITIYHGNCLKILPEIDKPIDLLLSDPQYGINIVKVKKGKTLGKIGGSVWGKTKKVPSSFWR